MVTFKQRGNSGSVVRERGQRGTDKAWGANDVLPTCRAIPQQSCGMGSHANTGKQGETTVLSSEGLKRLAARAICRGVVVGFHKAQRIGHIVRSAWLLTAAIAAVFKVRL